ncbi:CPBP family intramembrane glutamic endopeptidase [Nocardioides hwasunensis]|uniref:CPBP family intramembrane metalloprotease n=1 Tax=Nocardioides hwasunensis TaxID=397258 RepID=A0ABR8MAN8_9ACTN|nr:CPBP family intramembrane glutamic endopeptidase [Nocardioides hwasunensis]MBD3913213.1 CPBP family intramembrane metalloprotease [Nocardioides hwasunensis]
MIEPLDPSFRPRYHELHRVGRPGWWRSLVGAAVLLVLVFALVPLVAGGIAVAVLVATGSSMEEATAVLDITGEVSPTGLAVLNVILALAIPASWLVIWALHRLRPRWLSSVTPRLRWRFLLACLPISVVALLASLLVAVVVPTPDGAAASGSINDFTSTTRDFLLVIALLTPLQAAGEEYVFRGYLTQAFGSMVSNRRVSLILAVLVPSLLFALAHGAGQSVPVFFDRFAFGVVAGILVIRTGGLEAAIAMHVLNNFFAYGLALSFGDMTEALNASAPTSWWMIASTLAQSLVYLGLASWVAKAMGLVNVGPPVGGALPPASGRPELIGQPPRV